MNYLIAAIGVVFGAALGGIITFISINTIICHV